jgi:hypothetical protein
MEYYCATKVRRPNDLFCSKIGCPAQFLGLSASQTTQGALAILVINGLIVINDKLFINGTLAISALMARRLHRKTYISS